MVKVALLILAVAVVIGLISLRGLRQHMQRLTTTQSSEEQVRHEILSPPISTPTDSPVQAKIFWAAGPDKIAPVEVEIPLSADPVERCRQLLQTLIADPPTPDQRTLPASAVLLGFYILPVGTAVADFSDSLTSETPSGILSESMAVNSIVKTLAANVPSLQRLKILIHGQEVDTLAGNVDLTGFFDLNPAAPSAAAATPNSVSPLATASAQKAH